MSVSNVSTDLSAVWKFYRHPTPPPEPRDFSQFEAESAGPDASGVNGTASAGSASTNPASTNKVGADFRALLLDLQANGSAATPSSTRTPATDASTTGTSSSGTGSVASDLQTLFNDLQGGGGQGANGVGHHHHHHEPLPDATPGVSDPTVGAADGTQDGTSGLLGTFVKALQSYGASATGAQPSSNVTLSA